MKQLIEQILEELSTKEVFLFRVVCGECGTEFANRPVRFSKAGTVPASKNKAIIYEALYEQERRAARQRAVRDAAENLNYCPICKRLICNRCFLICDDLDMCKQCAENLEETGSPVISEVVEAVAD